MFKGKFLLICILATSVQYSFIIQKESQSSLNQAIENEIANGTTSMKDRILIISGLVFNCSLNEKGGKPSRRRRLPSLEGLKRHKTRQNN